MTAMTVEMVIKMYFTDDQGKALISRDKLYRMARAGTIPARRVAGRWFFSQAALDRWLRCDDFFRGKVAAKHRPVMLEPIAE